MFKRSRQHTPRREALVGEGATEQRPRVGYQPEPIPWHFKLLGLLLIPYLLFRFYQIVVWLMKHL